MPFPSPSGKPIKKQKKKNSVGAKSADRSCSPPAPASVSLWSLPGLFTSSPCPPASPHQPGMELARTEAAFLPCYSCCKCVMLRWSRLQSQPCVCLVSPFQNHSSLLRICALEGEEAGSAVGERPRTGVLRVFEASLRVVHAVPTCAVLAAALPLHSLSLLQCHRCPLGARGEGALSPVPGDGAGTRKSGGEREERAPRQEAISVL